MKTTINAKAAEWSDAIQAMWDSFEKAEGPIVTANWYPARPYQDEYSTGSEEEGFVYTVRSGSGHLVYGMSWLVGKPDAAYVEPRFAA
jgi:hypothetical protein